MSHGPSNEDRDLLSRLNALKSSTIELNGTKFSVSAPSTSSLPVDPLPARALFSDLTSRFNSLKGIQATSGPHTINQKTGTPLDVPELQNESNDKTVEELLAELGPEEEWKFGQDDKDEVEELLKHAKGALKDLETSQSEELMVGAAPIEHHPKLTLPAVDVSVFQPEAESEDDTERVESRKPVSLEHEADETLQKLLDEMNLDPAADGEAEANLPESPKDHQQRTSTLDLPSIPVNDPAPDPEETEEDSSLSARFASLSLPSVPTTLKSKSASTSKPPPPTDDEIDTWCIICLSDATLRCIGCDGDLYCNNCWMEGHTGEDAGYEERKHRAVQFVKGGGKKKQVVKRGRMVVGA